MKSARVEEALALLARPRDCPWRLELTKYWDALPDDGAPIAPAGAAARAHTAAAGAAALAILARDVARTRGEPHRLPPATTVAAAHGEWSNRTRHLLPLVPPDGSVPLIVLGRPRASLDEVAAAWGAGWNGPDTALVRPLSAAALARALPDMARLIAQGMRAMARAHRAPTGAALVGIAWRVLAGAVHRRWWQAQRSPATRIAFAHTGVADTTALELAMHAGGARTVHLAHGVAGGHNFDGLSSLYVAACAHDARVLAQTGYRRAAALPAPCPAATRATRPDWLLLTNFAHPTSEAYLARGIAAECDVLRLAAAAAGHAGVAPPLYRPHPARALLPAADRAALDAAVAGLGLAPWPEGLPYAAIADFATVLTTPSTVLLDLMRRGRLPVLLCPDAPDRRTLYADYAWRAGTPEKIAAQAARLAASPDALATAWEGIGPGGAFADWDALLAFCEQRGG
jgi:hypothetical protein